jgi:hypothetical protein
LKAAQALLKGVKAMPGGEQIIQVAGDGNTLNVNIPRNDRLEFQPYAKKE